MDGQLCGPLAREVIDASHVRQCPPYALTANTNANSRRCDYAS